MAHLDLDFTAPIALLVGALVAVWIVRAAVAHGDRRAAARARRLLREHGDEALSTDASSTREDTRWDG